MSYERTMPDGTPVLASIVMWAGEGAENDGAISFEDLQIIRKLADALYERGINDLKTLEERLTPH